MTIEQLHKKAMELADTAFIARSAGKLKQAVMAFRESLKYEAEAARKAKKEAIGEPSESVLCRSAAAIAFNAENFLEAEKLIGLGLSGNPPEEVAEELRNLYEDVNLNRHLRLNGLALAPDEVQLVIDGNSVGHGFARSNEVFDRVETIKTLAIRTAQRKLGSPFSDAGRPSKDMNVLFNPFISVPRAASFAFTLKFGEHSAQTKIPGGERATDVVTDLVQNLNYVNEGAVDKLKGRIADPGYFRNFWALSKELAPDGEKVKLVGLTIIRDGKEQRTALTRTRREYVMTTIDDLEAKAASKEHQITVVGRLSGADSDSLKIKITTKSKNQKFNVAVPEGLGDIVRKHFEQEVRIVGMQSGKTIRLKDLQPVSGD